MLIQASRVQRAGEGTHSEREHLPEESLKRSLKGERRERLADREKREDEEDLKILRGGQSAMVRSSMLHVVANPGIESAIEISRASELGSKQHAWHATRPHSLH